MSRGELEYKPGNGSPWTAEPTPAKSIPTTYCGGGAGNGSHACRANSQGSKGSAFSSEPHMCTSMCMLVHVSHGFMCDLVTSECASWLSISPHS